jgi:D-alanyl-D-alanine carboxypeptidase (penicillin-binding protein 5/6)
MPLLTRLTVLLGTGTLSVIAAGAAVTTLSPAGSTPAASAASPSVTPVAQVVHRTAFKAVSGSVTAPPKVRMRAWAIADLDTGVILAVHDHRRWLPQASTLKLLTAVTAASRVPGVPRHRVTYAEAHPQFCTCAGLRVGRRYTRAALMTGMLLPSGNDAAEALAGSDPRGHAAFIAAMNARAHRLGATDTHVVTPSGLTAAGAHSSARDLLVFLRAAQENTVVEPFLEMTSGRIGPLRGRSHVVYRATDYVNKYPTAEGKSGYTTPARNTLVVATPMSTPSGAVHRIGVATLGAPGGYSTTGTRALSEWAALNYDQLRPVGHLPAAPGPVVGAQASLASRR